MEITATISNLIDLHKAISELGNSFTIFRGVSSIKHKLVPKAGRYIHNRKNKRIENEQKMLNIFKERATPHLKFSPQDNFEWLAIAQHHGLATRFLDWSRNPLVAAYFAVEKDNNEDCAIYTYENPQKISAIELQKNDPFDCDNIFIYEPCHITPRITAQSGLFTLHKNPIEISFESDSIKILKIKNEAKKEFRLTLYRYGIHKASLFPDIDGISEYINWLCTEKEST